MQYFDVSKLKNVTRNILDCDQSNVLLAYYFPLIDARILEISLI